MQQLLRVHWPKCIEHISFDEDDVRSPIKTSERWVDGTEVAYDVDAEFFKRGKSCTLKLTYERDNQNDQVVREHDLRFPGDIRYGASTITWTTGNRTGHVTWKDNDGYDWSKESVVILGGQRVEVTEKTKNSVLVPIRKGQAAFRDALLQLDKCCVLSDETCPEALQAAHILPFAKNGGEQIENGILLRADLHLLFDAGVIWFEVKSDHAVVAYSKNLSAPYVKLLKDKWLRTKTFARVRSALWKRSKLPGGHGRDTDG